MYSLAQLANDAIDFSGSLIAQLFTNWYIILAAFIFLSVLMLFFLICLYAMSGLRKVIA